MTCEFIKNHLDEICSEQLEADQLKQAKSHVADCAVCNALINEHQHYLNTMRQFESPELTPESAAKMLKIAKANPSKQHYPLNFNFIKGFAAASVIFISLLTSWYFWQNNTGNQLADQQNALFSTNVTLVISVPADMPNTDLNIVLPENVALAGYEGLKEVSWPVDLKKGPNILSLPIKVAHTHDFSNTLNFIAKINYNNKQKKFDLKMSL